MTTMNRVSDYQHLHDPASTYRLKKVLQVLLKRASMSGMLVLDFLGATAKQKCASDLARWHREGRLRYRAHVIDGIENAFLALRLLLTGGNQGRLLAKPPTSRTKKVWETLT
jgi:NADPH-dependent curcumin reductase CurA